ncbi:MAG: type III-A CRISPR-associated RAMP protein Csm4 [candidate division WOR-3 bacterium]
MKTLALRLKPLSGPLVFQNELPRSDTLFGALVWAMKELGLIGDPKTEFLDLYEKSPPLVLSSVFPCAYEKDDKGEDIVVEPPRYFFLPKPMYETPGGDFQDEAQYEIFKRRKKLRWLKADDFQKAVSEGSLECLKDLKTDEDFKKYPSPGKLNERPRVRVPRTGGETDLFYQRLVILSAGAWLVMRGEDEWLDKAKAALRFIGDRGLGGGATYGMGCFELGETDMPFEEFTDGNAWVSLSLYYPQHDEWERIRKDPISAYRTERRKGRVDSSRLTGGVNVFKRPVLYMAEGSVLPWLDNPTPGKNPDVTPEGENRPDFSVIAQGVAFAVRATKRESYDG